MDWNWRCSALLVWLFLGGAAQTVGADTLSDIMGKWEGESLCTIPNSPCHDEHVVYHIKSAPQGGGSLVIAAYKIVDGEEGFMGDMECRYHSDTLSCSGDARREDDWEFRVLGKRMTGTLVMGKEKRLYRKVRVEKKSD